MVGTIGSAGGVPIWLSIPVTIALALAVTQLLAVGMTSPLRQMTAAARRMATGDHSVRVAETSRDEIGELARAFNRMAEELAGVDRQRRELVANVSHELRTPLAALCALLENLADGVAEPDPETLRAALEQGERMTALVTDLLDLSRVDAGKAPLDLQDVEVGPLLEAAVAELRISGRDVTYAVQVSPPDLVVKGDPARLRQLVANLLDNASRHSPPGGTVTVRADVFGDHWHLVVADQGPGVAPAQPRARVRAVRDAHRHRRRRRDRPRARDRPLGHRPARGVDRLRESRARRVRCTCPGRPPAQPHPRSSQGEPHAPARRHTRCRTAPAVPRRALPSLTDVAFGDFWPEARVPGNVRVLLGALGVGVLAGALLPFRDHGLAVFLVLVAAGGVVLTASRNRRDPFTRACAGAVPGAVGHGRAAGTPSGSCCSAWSPAPACASSAWCAAATWCPSCSPGIAWPFAGLRGMPWLGRTLRRVTGMGGGAALVRTAVVSVLGSDGVRPAVRLG